MADSATEDAAKTLSLKRSGQQACVRCRRQKLRCDEIRPCALCLRSGFECKEVGERPRKIKKTHQPIALELLPRPPSEIPDANSAEAVSLNAQATGSTQSSINPKSGFTAINSQSVAETQTSPTFHERTSTVHLMEQVFQKHKASPPQKRVVDALPGSRLDDANPDSSRGNHVSVQEVIGMRLPPRPVTDSLLSSYLKNYHWHLLLFHAPTLVNQLQPILEQAIVPKGRLSLVMLLLVILTLGARYVSGDPAQGLCSNKDIRRLETAMKTKIEENFMRILDETSVESVTFTLLFASYCMYNRKPKRAYKLIQMAIRDAQAMGLDRESTWGQLDTTAREVRRRLWWSLYGCDGFDALMFGQPGIIRTSDYQVQMQTDIDDTLFTCPGFGSMETRESARTEPVTILSYHRYKVTLYQIAEPITRSVYFHKDAGKNVVKHVQDIHKRLVRWYKRLPPELKLDSLAGASTTPDKALALDIFRRQALALQLSYDNMQIVLHRSLIAYEDPLGLSSSSTSQPEERHDGNGATLSSADAAAVKISRNQCWESAIRTSLLVDHPTELKLVRSTPVAAYLAMQAHTAGVMLGVFALSNPSSDRAQQAKQGIARLIQMPAMVSFQDAAWQQCVGILENMLRLILSEELKVLMSGQSGISGTATSRVSVPQALQRNKPHQHMSVSRHGSVSTRSDGDQKHPSTQLSNGGHLPDTIDLTQGNYSPPANADGVQQHKLENPSPSTHSVFSPLDNFSNAISSLQTMFRDNGSNGSVDHPGIHSASSVQQRGNVFENNQQYSGLEPTASGNDQMNQGLEFVDNPFVSLEGVDQLWLWNDDFSFWQA